MPKIPAFINKFKKNPIELETIQEIKKLEQPAHPLINPNPKQVKPAIPQLSEKPVIVNNKFNLFDKLKELKRWQKILLGTGVVLVFVLTILSVLGIYTYFVSQKMMGQARELQATGTGAYADFKAQNLPATQEKIILLQKQLGELDNNYHKLSFYKFVPFASKYYQDGESGLYAASKGLDAALTTIEAITPYADVLGFSGEGSFEGGTAEDRVKLILQTLEKVTPQLDSIEANLAEMNTALAKINPKDYPEQLAGKSIKTNIIKVQDSAQAAVTALTDYRPIIEKLPEIAGAQGERKKYLVLFQNDNELRPTGGFLTAYAVIYIENGKVTQEKSDDIYELDQKFKKQEPIPEELGRYLTTEKYWNLRDMNVSPDFKVSMEKFIENYKNVKGEPGDIEGVIAVDTEFLTRLVEVVGPVEVPGYGTFGAQIDERCDCPQIIYVLSEIITKPTPYMREDRKGILGPLMNAIIQKVYMSPRAFMAQLFAVGLEGVEGRYLQAYLFNNEHQAAIEAINAGGLMEPPQNGEDFVAIIDANLAGAKSNLFTSYEVEQAATTPTNGMIEKTLTITYKNSRQADNCNLEAGKLCLNSTLKDWFRLYVPAGSQLTDAQGFLEEPKVYEEDGFQVFDSYFVLEPKSQAKLKISYKVPYNKDNYQVQVWKQGGVDPFEYFFDTNGGQEKILIDKDTLYQTDF